MFGLKSQRTDCIYRWNRNMVVRMSDQAWFWGSHIITISIHLANTVPNIFSGFMQKVIIHINNIMISYINLFTKKLSVSIIDVCKLPFLPILLLLKLCQSTLHVFLSCSLQMPQQICLATVHKKSLDMKVWGEFEFVFQHLCIMKRMVHH